MDKIYVSSIEELRDLLKDFFKGYNVEVFLFGSRAAGRAAYSSDIDLAFLSDDDIAYKLSLLREILENSNLLQKVDLVDLKKAPALKDIVKTEGIRWM